MSTELEIANLALAHLAVGRPIGAMAEDTQAARTMTQFYAQARSEAFRAFNWPFARKFASLTLVAGSDTTRASVDFQYSYRYPADCLYARILRTTPRRGPLLASTNVFGVPFVPSERGARVPFIVGQDATGGLIFTDAAVVAATTDFPAYPELEYTVLVDEATWPPEFVAAVSFLLAWYAAPLLTAGDPHKLGDRAAQQYGAALDRAQGVAWNEQEQDYGPEPDSSFIIERQ